MTVRLQNDDTFIKIVKKLLIAVAHHFRITVNAPHLLDDQMDSQKVQVLLDHVEKTFCYQLTIERLFIECD